MANQRGQKGSRVPTAVVAIAPASEKMPRPKPKNKPKPQTAPSDLHVVQVALADLQPYPRNPRNITPAAVNAVAESLAAFGWQQPIVIDPKKVIVAGHTRRLAALQLGWTHAPTVTIPAKHARAYRLADNRSGEFSTWDLDTLRVEISDLPDLPAGLGLSGLLEPLPVSAEWPVALGLEKPEYGQITFVVSEAQREVVLRGLRAGHKGNPGSDDENRNARVLTAWAQAEIDRG